MDFYDRNSESYAEGSFTRNLESLLDPFCKLVLAKGSVLDLGSGSGRDSLALNGRGFTVFSIDRSRGMLREHRKKGGMNLIQGDLIRLPFRKGSFDGVWACASILHIPKAGLSTALAESKRVLRTDGILFLSLKAGVGEKIDALGRFCAYYSEDELARALAIEGFLPIENSRTKDLAGREVEWINLLAKPFQKP